MTEQEFRAGDRVLAPWEPSWLYPGKVRSVDARGAFIEFDDGDMAAIPQAELQLLVVTVGLQVQARWNRGPKQYLTAYVTAVRGEELDLRYEDGREEITTVSFVRFPRGLRWSEGDRVFAPWEADWYYPGRIRCIDEETVFIKFDDGGKALVNGATLRAMRVNPGDRVFARRGYGATSMYEPATVTAVHGDELELLYDDGGAERTTPKFIRVR